MEGGEGWREGGREGGREGKREGGRAIMSETHTHCIKHTHKS